MSRWKLVIIGIIIFAGGFYAGARFTFHIVEVEERESRDIDRAFAQVKNKGPNFSRKVSPFLTADKNYQAALDECETLALLSVNFDKTNPDAGMPFTEFEVIGSESSFNDSNILLIDIKGGSGSRMLFGCYLDKDLDAKSGRILYRQR